MSLVQEATFTKLMDKNANRQDTCLKIKFAMYITEKNSLKFISHEVPYVLWTYESLSVSHAFL